MSHVSPGWGFPVTSALETEESFGFKTFELRSQKVYTHQALTAAYKDIVIRLFFFDGLEILWSSRHLFKLFDNDIFLMRIFVEQTKFISILIYLGAW